MAIPNVLAIAATDSSGGAGLLADVRTCAALGAYAAGVVTAVTAQNTREVRAIRSVPVPLLRRQLEAVLDDMTVHATKIGLVPAPRLITALAGTLREADAGPIVLDPVLRASTGRRLVRSSMAEALLHSLVPLATVLTPNLEELAVLAGVLGETGSAPTPLPSPSGEGGAPEPEGPPEPLLAAALTVLEAGPRWLLVKGGHGGGTESVDWLLGRGGSGAEGTGELEVRAYRGPRIATPHGHGTGCTLASAIAAGLALGLEVPEAVGSAKAYVSGALRGASGLAAGRGPGPLDHFWRCRA